MFAVVGSPLVTHSNATRPFCGGFVGSIGKSQPAISGRRYSRWNLPQHEARADRLSLH